MKYLHYVYQKYVVGLEAKGIIKTEKLANPWSISLANPTFTFSIVVWQKFCRQGAKNLQTILLHLGRMKMHHKNREADKTLLYFLCKSYFHFLPCCLRCYRNSVARVQKILAQHLQEILLHLGQIKMHRKNRELGKSLKAVSWASNSKLLFPTKQDFSSFFVFFFFNLSFLNKIAGPLSPMGPI